MFWTKGGYHQEKSRQFGDEDNDDEKPTRLELQRALQIKRAAQDDPTIADDAISDWEFLQHAIVSKDQTSKALDRLRNLQAFKDRYGIKLDGSVDEAVRDLQIFLQTHPEFYLSLSDGEKIGTKQTAERKKSLEAKKPSLESSTTVSSSSTTDNEHLLQQPQILCFLYKGFNAKVMNHEEAFCIYMRAAFYALNASQHNLAALRGGLAVYIDCADMSIRQNYSRLTEQRARQLYVGAYPVRVHEFAMLNVFCLMRWSYRLIKPFLSPKIVQLLRMEDNSTEFLHSRSSASNHSDASIRVTLPKDALPKAWGGTRRVEDFAPTILKRLRQRYRAIATFRLDDFLESAN